MRNRRRFNTRTSPYVSVDEGDACSMEAEWSNLIFATYCEMKAMRLYVKSKPDEYIHLIHKYNYIYLFEWCTTFLYQGAQRIIFSALEDQRQNYDLNWLKSSFKIRKNVFNWLQFDSRIRGPRTEPCGRPYGAGTHRDLVEPWTTLKVRMHVALSFFFCSY